MNVRIEDSGNDSKTFSENERCELLLHTNSRRFSARFSGLVAQLFTVEERVRDTTTRELVIGQQAAALLRLLPGAQSPRGGGRMRELAARIHRQQ
eukprot:6183878-Pleurochrysis_carterae.AAC.1